MLEYQGEVQEGRVGTPLEPFQLVVKDGEGNPLPNHPLEFLVVEGKGTFTHTDTSTDQTGSAIAEFVPEDPGRFRVECRVGPERREIASFKGLVEGEVPKRKPRTRRSTAAPPPQAATSRPTVPPPPPLPTIETPKAAPEPPAPPSPPVVEAVAPAAAPAAIAPAASPAPPRIAVRAPAAPKAAVQARTAMRTRPRARPRQVKAMSLTVRRLLIAVVVVSALLALLSGILVIQDLTRHHATAPLKRPGSMSQTVPAQLVSPR